MVSKDRPEEVLMDENLVESEFPFFVVVFGRHALTIHLHLFSLS